MNLFIRIAALTSLLATAVVAAERPNIVLIFSDDQGVNDVGCYGSEIPTPHIDRIAQQGIQFRSWYSASSICTPSRFGLLTGRNPSRSRDGLLSALMFLSEEDARRGLHDDETTVAELLAGAGYVTALFGKWHLGHGNPGFLPVHHGFRVFKGHTGGCIDYFTMTYGIQNDWYEGTQHVARNGYATELITAEAVEFLKEQQSSDKPFFLFLPYNAPHFGKGWNPAAQETVNIMQAQGRDLQRVSFIQDKIRRDFAAMVVSLDDGVGQVMQALEAGGHSDNTLLIFLTDHGGDPVYGGSNRPLRGSKATLFDGGLKVPCVMKWPGHIAAGRTSTAVASSLDLFPTFCDIAGIGTASQTLDGLSLKGHLLEESELPQRELFWQTGQHAELDRGTWSALRQGRWKYVQDAAGVEYVFDLAADATEQSDLSDSAPEILARLRDRTRFLAREYRDAR